MLDGLISGLVIAWLLSWFDFDKIFIKGINQLFKLNIGKEAYYLIFAISGVLQAILK